MRNLIRMAVLAALVLCGGLAATGLAAAAEYTIVIDKMQFGPVPAGLRSGDTIIWQNNDIFRHTATAVDASFDIDLPAHAEATMVVGAAGSLDFFCRFHPGMTGTLVVAP